MEIKGINYQYIEVDPYKKPESLLEVNPRGLVPALRHGDWGCYESTVLMEYVRIKHQVLECHTDAAKVGRPGRWNSTSSFRRPQSSSAFSSLV